MSKHVNIISFGCRLNSCESEIIESFAQELRLQNYTIINTCAVTAEAERKLKQTIRKLYKHDPLIQIILTGCAIELNHDYYLAMPGVFGIISNNIKLSKSSYIDYANNNDGDHTSIHTEQSTQDIEPQKIRGFLQIQNGCDQLCTYCIVRITRGKSISFCKDEIVSQARSLINKGYKEIALTGVNISSYGHDICGKESLSSLINYLFKNVPEIERLRLSSLDPADVSDELINIITNEQRLMPHIHQSIQSGDNMILKRMRRRHLREHVIEINNKIIAKRPECIFGGDFIVGFPTENDEMFLNTINLLNEANIVLTHIFPYSKRPGTSAALMPQVDKKTSLYRAKVLNIVSQNILNNKLKQYINTNIRFIAETDCLGKTDNFLEIKSLAPLIVGKVYEMNCIDVEHNHLMLK